MAENFEELDVDQEQNFAAIVIQRSPAVRPIHARHCVEEEKKFKLLEAGEADEAAHEQEKMYLAAIIQAFARAKITLHFVQSKLVEKATLLLSVDQEQNFAAIVIQRSPAVRPIHARHCVEEEKKFKLLEAGEADEAAHEQEKMYLATIIQAFARAKKILATVPVALPPWAIPDCRPGTVLYKFTLRSQGEGLTAVFKNALEHAVQFTGLYVLHQCIEDILKREKPLQRHLHKYKSIEWELPTGNSEVAPLQQLVRKFRTKTDNKKNAARERTEALQFKMPQRSKTSLSESFPLFLQEDPDLPRCTLSSLDHRVGIEKNLPPIVAHPYLSKYGRKEIDNLVAASKTELASLAVRSKLREQLSRALQIRSDGQGEVSFNKDMTWKTPLQSKVRRLAPISKVDEEKVVVPLVIPHRFAVKTKAPNFTCTDSESIASCPRKKLQKTNDTSIGDVDHQIASVFLASEKQAREQYIKKIIKYHSAAMKAKHKDFC